ncbi:MAG: trigger factor [Archangium sp.]|nr:trigger factor [Archangium sp.]
MKVQVEDVSAIEKRLTIEVDPALVEKELAAAYSNLARQVKVPGFRPGKIPRRILEQKFKSEVEADVVKRVQLLGFIDALKETNVAAVGDPAFSGGKLESAKPYAYSARVEVKPVVTAKDYKGLTLPAFDSSVADEKVNEQIKRFREQRTEVVDVTDRDTVQKGDLVVIDFDATKGAEKTPFPGNTGRDVTVEVAEGELIDGNLPALEGSKLNEKKEFDYTFPADYRVEEVKGQTAHFTCTIKALKAKKMPDDATFAKDMGEESFDALKARVRKDLERAAKNRADVDARDALFKSLIEKNPIDVPTAMVNRGIDFMLENAFQGLMRSGMDPNMLQLDWGKLREEMRPKAALEVRGQLLLESIAGTEKIAVNDDELTRRIEELAKENNVGLPILQKQYTSPEAKDGLRNRMKEEKVIAFLRENAAK